MLCDNLIKKIVILFIILMLFSCGLLKSKVIMISYNVQNFFDDEYEGTEYKDFKDISTALYEQKTSNLVDAFERISKSYGKPSVVLLQEVEHRGVIEELIKYSTSLRGMNVIFSKEPSHATGIAILTRYEILEVINLQVQDVFNKEQYLRPILIAILKLSNGQVLSVVNVHLHSQSQEKNKLRRNASLKHLYSTIEKLRKEYGSTLPIIIGGDFNIDLKELVEIIGIINISEDKSAMKMQDFYNPWPNYVHVIQKNTSILGSYFYRGTWQALDGFLLSKNLLLDNGLTFIRQEPISLAYFLEEYNYSDQEKRSIRPKAFYRNNISGVSDHLPVVAVFRYYELIKE